jgi:hypothetical protein
LGPSRSTVSMVRGLPDFQATAAFVFMGVLSQFNWAASADCSLWRYAKHHIPSVVRSDPPAHRSA